MVFTPQKTQNLKCKYTKNFGNTEIFILKTSKKSKIIIRFVI